MRQRRFFRVGQLQATCFLWAASDWTKDLKYLHYYFPEGYPISPSPTFPTQFEGLGFEIVVNGFDNHETLRFFTACN